MIPDAYWPVSRHAFTITKLPDYHPITIIHYSLWDLDGKVELDGDRNGDRWVSVAVTVQLATCNVTCNGRRLFLVTSVIRYRLKSPIISMLYLEIIFHWST